VETIVQAHEVVDAQDAVPLKISQGRIEFRHVCFAYEPNQPVFEGLSVVIEPGQRVGLSVFPVRKSTFVSLMLRNYQPQSGQILIDGMDIQHVLQDSLHEQVSLIPQDPACFIAVSRKTSDMAAWTWTMRHRSSSTHGACR